MLFVLQTSEMGGGIILCLQKAPTIGGRRCVSAIAFAHWRELPDLAYLLGRPNGHVFEVRRTIGLSTKAGVLPLRPPTCRRSSDAAVGRYRPVNTREHERC